jgi:hypothetical protein
VATDKKWTSPDGKAFLAFLAVDSFEEGTELINTIGRIGGTLKTGGAMETRQ